MRREPLLEVVAEPLLHVDEHPEAHGAPVVPAEGEDLPAAHAELRPLLVLGGVVRLAEGLEEGLDLLATLEAAAVVDDLDRARRDLHVDAAGAGLDRVHDALEDRLLDRAGLPHDHVEQELLVHAKTALLHRRSLHWSCPFCEYPRLSRMFSTRSPRDQAMISSTL